MIYFIRTNDRAKKFIKIGYTSGDDATERLRACQTGSAIPLKLIAIMNGDINFERELHQQFAEYRAEGEWFKASDELLDYITGNATMLDEKKQRRPNSSQWVGQFTGEVLKAAIKVLLDDGHKVTVNNMPAKDDRPAGLLLFVAGMTYKDGVFAVTGKAEPEAVKS